MQSQRKLMISIGLVISLLFSSVALAAQAATATGDWGSLRNLAVDSKIVVQLKTGKTVQGKFKNVSDSFLTIISKSAPVEIGRDEISTVYELVKKSATKSTLIGLGVGAGAGAAIGAAASASDDSGFEKVDHAATAGLAVAGAVAGALTGFMVGRGGTKRVLIYESK